MKNLYYLILDILFEEFIMNVKPKGITAPLSQEELSNRLKKVRILMNKENLDYYVSFDPINIYYLTNFANKSQ